MASTYVNDLRLNEMATGDGSGTWGTTTNTNLELIGEALGYGTEGITTNADTHTSTIADGATDPVRAMYVKYTGTLDSACTITIAPNTINRMQFIENATSGSQNIIISQGSGANITIPAGDVKAVYLDGAGSGAAVVDAFASLNVVDLKVQDDLTVTDDLIVNGDIDLEGSIDVNGTANLDVVDIDGAVDMASTLQVDGAITSSAGATITLADNTDNLTLVSTDADANKGPNLVLYRNSASPADGDMIGQVRYDGENSAGETISYAKAYAETYDITDGTEDGRYFITTMVGGSESIRMYMNFDSTTFNDSGADIDFRVESDGDTHALFVKAADNRVGVMTSNPYTSLTVGESDAEAWISAGGTNTHLTLSPVGSSGALIFKTNSTNSDPSDATEKMRIDPTGDIIIGALSKIYSYGDADSFLQFNQANTLRFVIGDSTRLIINTGETVFNEDTGNFDFRVETDGATHALFADAGSNFVAVHASGAPSGAGLHVGSYSDKHFIGMTTPSAISGSGQYGHLVEGVAALSTSSSGNQVTIPIYSQTSLWRPQYVELKFVSMEYNMSGNVDAGTIAFSFSCLNSIAVLTEITKTGNCSGVSSSSMNILVSFTNAYTGGLSDYEGVLMYYRVLGVAPTYVEMWDASLN
jgi:hypothetical protein